MSDYISVEFPSNKQVSFTEVSRLLGVPIRAINTGAGMMHREKSTVVTCRSSWSQKILEEALVPVIITRSDSSLLNITPDESMKF